MVYYKPIKIIINALDLIKVIINVVVWDYSLLDVIVTNQSSFFGSNSDYCYATFLVSNNAFL